MPVRCGPRSQRSSNRQQRIQDVALPRTELGCHRTYGLPAGLRPRPARCCRSCHERCEPAVDVGGHATKSCPLGAMAPPEARFKVWWMSLRDPSLSAIPPRPSRSLADLGGWPLPMAITRARRMRSGRAATGQCLQAKVRSKGTRSSRRAARGLKLSAAPRLPASMTWQRRRRPLKQAAADPGGSGPGLPRS